jgi:hypothetical protein
MNFRRLCFLLFIVGCTNRDTYKYLNKTDDPTVTSYDFTPGNIDNYGHNGVTVVEGNKYEFSIQCNGKDSYIRIPYSDSLPEGSFEAYVYMDEPRPLSGIIHKESHSLKLNEDDKMEHEDDDDSAEDKDKFPEKKWVHVVSTWNAQTVSLYYNGVLVISVSRKDNKEIQSSFIFICSTGKINSSWSGKMEGIKVHKKCLSSDEVHERSK